MNKRSCASCINYNRTQVRAGECRASPPVPFVLPGAPGQVSCIGFYPPTKADGWCGSWRTQTEDTTEQLASSQLANGDVHEST